jgi:hypothetical protein
MNHSLLFMERNHFLLPICKEGKLFHYKVISDPFCIKEFLFVYSNYFFDLFVNKENPNGQNEEITYY